MAEVTFDVAPTTPKKRPLEEDSMSETIELSREPLVKAEAREGSPAPSTSSSLTELTGSIEPGSASKSATSSAMKAGPSKKRKLGLFEAQAEKAAKQREKDEKARQKADEKAKKEEEKARKDEEKKMAAEEKENAKRAKELEKAEKQKAKDEEKQKKEHEKALKEAEKAQKDAEKRAKDAEKEAEKQRKEAEKLRKERSQMRLGAFFVKPKSAEDTPPSTPDDVSEGASSRRSSIASIDAEKPKIPTLKHNQFSNPDYEKFFLAYELPQHTDVAPANRHKRVREADFEIIAQQAVPHVREHFPRPKKRIRRTVSIREIIENMHATGLNVIDLDSDALNALAKSSYKCLRYREDVRPPYQGTYSRVVSPQSSRKLSRDPFARQLPDTNYDYDSEAEWEEPAADDEDLEDEDEMSDTEEAGDDMNEFLDDADDMVRKKGLVSDMEPISSGLCWADQVFDDHGTNLQQYRMDVLHDSTVFPINPYSDQHWAEGGKPKVLIRQESTSTLMQPPRQPLSSLSPNAGSVTSTQLGVDGKPMPVSGQKKATTSKIPKMIEPSLMDEFKEAINGSDLTKLGLMEILKKQFPQCSKDAIKDTLGAVAVRVGKKEAEKKWQLIDGA